MSEWWAYSLADLLMFSSRTYYRLFELYNRVVWPAHVVAGAIGCLLVVTVMRRDDRNWKPSWALLASCWLWVAWAFHARSYSTINTAAMYFAAAFALQAVLLLWLGLLNGRGKTSAGGLAILLFALIGYPFLAPASGRGWEQAEVFGMAPDPTVAATLGLLLFRRKRSALLWPIPLIWCAVTGATQWTMRVPYWWGLPFIAVLALVLKAAHLRGRQ